MSSNCVFERQKQLPQNLRSNPPVECTVDTRTDGKTSTLTLQATPSFLIEQF